jgi:flagellar M-ring protein FliF
MEKYRQQALELWRRWQALSLARKVAWSAAALVCLALAGIVWWAAQPEYRVLYVGLSVEEAGAITSKLQAKGVPFKLTAGGTTILVPAEQAMQVHLDMNNDGIAGSSKIAKGWDSFDQGRIGATPFDNSVTFMRAQQAELARTIMQIDPIIYARVHIVRPETSPFIREKKVATASVMIKCRPGASLGRNTVDGIAALVSGSLEGLNKENVRIIDANGRLLSKSQDPEAGGLGTLVDQKRDMEQYLAGEAERMLTSVLGAGRAVVVVRADLNDKQMREKKEIFNSESRVEKSAKTTLNKTNTSSSVASKGGAAGSSSNLGKATGGASAGGSVTSQETQQSDYDYPRTIQEWQNKIGSIERLTVAAFVDISASDKSEQAISLADVKETIKKAVGFKADRDEIQVTQVRMPAATSEGFDEEWATHQRWQTILTMVRNGSMAMVALCGLPIAWLLFRRRGHGAPQGAGAVAQAEPAKLQRLSEELDRNPEGLAKVLALWIDRAEASDRKAA